MLMFITLQALIRFLQPLHVPYLFGGHRIVFRCSGGHR